MAINHSNPRVGNSPEETDANERSAKAMREYRVTNSAGGTEFRTRSKAAAINKLNNLAFPGDVQLRRNRAANWETIELELNDDGVYVEVAS